MQFSVFSEVGRLNEVLVHAPGLEISQMPPALMEELLFDDLLYLEAAQQEHDFFQKVMAGAGVKVRHTLALLKSTLKEASDSDRQALIDDIAYQERLPNETIEKLSALKPGALAHTFVEGMLAPKGMLAPDRIYDLYPIPNLLFSRDAQTVMGDGIIFCSMKYDVRKRESMLSHFIFTNHKRYADNSVIKNFNQSSLAQRAPIFGKATVEGGDILVLKEGIVLVGVSERSTERGIEELSRALKKNGQFSHLIMVPMPANRSQMHLDTIFTRVSEEECLVYSPMIEPGSAETLSATILELTGENTIGRRYSCLLDALKSLRVDLKPIACGGRDHYLDQAREQWTDGANSFAIAPGVIFLYDRNVRTIEELSKNGYHVVQPDDFKENDEANLEYDFVEGKKYVISFPSTELTRARGGPRCMTMPLSREPV